MASSSPSVTSVTPIDRPASSSASRPGRRRQRSVRVTVAVGLMLLATGGTAVALPYQSATWLSAAAVASLLCGWAAARIMHGELTQSWREAAADRAAQAHAYRIMFDQRADEHAAFTSAVSERLRSHERELHELGESLVAAERRTVETEALVQRETRRADDAAEHAEQLLVVVGDLERTRDVLEAARAVLEEELTERQATIGTPSAAPTDGAAVADLVAWEQRVSAAHRPETEQQRA